jgi:hypothetical protein
MTSPVLISPIFSIAGFLITEYKKDWKYKEMTSEKSIGPFSQKPVNSIFIPHQNQQS